MTKYRRIIAEELSPIKNESIKRIRRVTDMLGIDFSNGMSLHCQTQVRFRTRSKLLFTRDDIYVTEDFDDIDSRNNYQINSQKYLPRVIGQRIVSVRVNEIGDITLKLENGVMVEVLIKASKDHFYDYFETYRILYEDENKKHLVVLNDKRIDFA